MQIKSDVSFENTSVAFSAKSDAALQKAHLLFSVINNPMLSTIAQALTKIALTLRLPIKGLVKKTVFAQFCGGETIEDNQGTIDELAQFEIGSILDYSVEGAETEEGFESATAEIIRAIHMSHDNPDIPFIVFKVTGIAPTALLEKIQSKTVLKPDEQEAYTRVLERVERICNKAYELNVRVLIDAEESWIQGCIDRIAYTMMKRYNKDEAIVYNTYQMYRKDMLGNLRNAFHYAALSNYWLGAKLVRGAYMEKENARAEELGYKTPIHDSKAATDADYNRGLKFCLDNKQRIALVCGSHNEQSNYYLLEMMYRHSLSPNDARIWFSQLYGMSDNISYNLAKEGYNVAKYVPYGPVRSVMPYLFRRAKENTSVAGQSSRELTFIKKEIARRKQVKT